MATGYIAFDNKSGRILSVHHGAVDERRARESALQHAKIEKEHLGIITVNPGAVSPGKLYKVDVERNVLVETERDGVGFGFGQSGVSN